MRIIKKIHKSIYSPIDNLITYRALPTGSIRYMDPFLFLNHHGPKLYPAGNDGLPFGPHPHRGFETLTIIYQGDIMHWDSNGNKSIISDGGIQWMTAGKGIIHSEISSDEFKQHGGMVEVIQIWLNLPSRLKMTEPNYIGLQKDQIPEVITDNGKVTLNVIAGKWENKDGALKPLTDIEICNIKMKTGGKYSLDIDASRTILFYVLNGDLTINNTDATTHDLVEFTDEGQKLEIEAKSDTFFVLGHGIPFYEPIVAQGPFVMNNLAEIKQAYMDYTAGKMGKWNF
jgi:redox-sensitive bicupin YhaK (pirin superfamily)